LLNHVKKLINFNPINEEILKLHNLPTYFLPIIEKIIKFDFSIELEIQEHYFTARAKEILG
ncbi:MAG: hypothetical protein ACFFDN_51190, partial [Candidatus Hodarchaeota archaeon]